MTSLARHLTLTLSVHSRQRLGMFYGFLFPLIFMAAFRALYRWEEPPLIRHVGELLTVAILGGACFGLPVAIVGERERGVWRRYRLVPASPFSLVLGTVGARFVLLAGAALLQLGLAALLGMPAPAHPVQLAIGFTVASLTFIGVGLLMAMLADTVPAAQALGQCVFLPMLVLGGVVVKVPTLPDWAQRLASFLPGNYAVEIMQACAVGEGLASVLPDLGALLAMGAAAFLVATKLFRWDTRARSDRTASPAWGVGLVSLWVAIGLVIGVPAPATAPMTSVESEAGGRPDALVVVTPPADSAPANPPTPPTQVVQAPAVQSPVTAPSGTSSTPSESAPVATAAAPEAATTEEYVPAKRWFEVKEADVRHVNYNVPPDEGVVAPWASPRETPDPDTASWVEFIGGRIDDWQPARVPDIVQRVRNLIYIAAVPDTVQMDPLERFLPWTVYNRLVKEVPKEDLIKLLTWIALHPDEGSLSAVDQMPAVGIEVRTDQWDTVRERTRYYAVKFLVELTQPR